MDVSGDAHVARCERSAGHGNAITGRGGEHGKALIAGYRMGTPVGGAEERVAADERERRRRIELSGKGAGLVQLNAIARNEAAAGSFQPARRCQCLIDAKREILARVVVLEGARRAIRLFERNPATVANAGILIAGIGRLRRLLNRAAFDRRTIQRRHAHRADIGKNRPRARRAASRRARRHVDDIAEMQEADLGGVCIRLQPDVDGVGAYPGFEWKCGPWGGCLSGGELTLSCAVSARARRRGRTAQRVGCKVRGAVGPSSTAYAISAGAGEGDEFQLAALLRATGTGALVWCSLPASF